MDGPATTGAITGYEAELWKMADALRGSMDAAEYKHVVLGLIFLKYISDAFEEARAGLELEQTEGADPERTRTSTAHIFWVPPPARWSYLRSQAKQPGIGRLVDDAMLAIERDNAALKDVLPKNYARQSLDQTRLGQIIDLVSNIRVGDAESRAKDVLGRVYEYFLAGVRIGWRRTSAGGSVPLPGATPTSLGSSTSCITWRRPGWRASCSPMGR